MSQAIVSTKFQVVIPKAVRRELGLKSGQVVQIIAKNGVISLVPDQPLNQLRGYLKGMKSQPLREKKDRP
ncbi:MAG TPA: AbrB/MazE/SpoVT family DNA-binding domain-containing protein [Thermoanaerobaculia bacterium]|jgi:AbrB family looped-hinge helix DNA binding protein|nr:AbrB/MazE/SpoVT family DNA-binding domain-containing protein [Thermoanaerobaculia bacterium]